MAAKIADIAVFSNQQLGLVTNAQFKSRGWSKDQIKWAATRGFIVSVRPDVWRMSSVRPNWEQTVLAAALSAGATSRTPPAPPCGTCDIPGGTGPVSISAGRRGSG